MSYERELQIALDAVAQASRLCRAVRAGLVSEETMAKSDESPVTVADFGAQAIVCRRLAEAFPDAPIVAEETSADLRRAKAGALREKVVQYVAAEMPGTTEAEALEAIDRGDHPGGAEGRCWVLDPIDGTKGFLRGEQYAVALALLEEGRVVLGVLGCPNLPARPSREEAAKGCLFYAVAGEGAQMRALGGGLGEVIRVSEVQDLGAASFCESVEAAHSSHGDAAQVAALLGTKALPIRMDSQCKYSVVARGEASIYLRLPAKPGYTEKIWDHAAGSIIVREAGGEVTDVKGRPLDFSRGRQLQRNGGIVATNGRIHAQVVAAVQAVLGRKRG